MRGQPVGCFGHFAEYKAGVRQEIDSRAASVSAICISDLSVGIILNESDRLGGRRLRGRIVKQRAFCYAVAYEYNVDVSFCVACQDADYRC